VVDEQDRLEVERGKKNGTTGGLICGPKGRNSRGKITERHIASSKGGIEASRDTAVPEIDGLWRDARDQSDYNQEKYNQRTAGGKEKEESKVGGKEVEHVDNRQQGEEDARTVFVLC
jgi:hypothetical protein